MKKNLQRLVAFLLLFLPVVPLLGQPLEPFQGCPGVSVAVTRPGFNLNLVPHQIYLIDDTTGAVTPTGNPIDHQINGFGLNNTDGFLYAMHETFNVANPFFTRVDKNGNFEIVGTILAPNIGPFKTGVINTAAGTMDDEDNYYFTAAVINLQNILLPPDLYVGKIEKVSKLKKGDRPVEVKYKKVTPGSCLDELLASIANPINGAVQDIAFNPANRSLYTYLPGPNGTGGKIAYFNPSAGTPSMTCINPAQPNIPTTDLSGLFFNKDTALFILTIDGKYYKGNVTTGAIELVAQTTLPLENNNLRGDMASCLGIKKPAPFKGCPGLALAITRPGINSTVAPHQVYKINPANGAIQPVGHPINLQINAFGLNNKDGFLYGMHEVADIFGPTLARVDSNGDYVDLGKLTPPPSSGSRVGIINTAAATMDGKDNYYFTAIVADTTTLIQIPRLYLGTIKDVSKIKAGDEIKIKYERIFIGTCIDEILHSLSNPSNGLLQDIAYNPKNGRIYTYIQSGASPARGKLAYIRLGGRSNLTLNCVNPSHNTPVTQDLSGMHADEDGNIFILTIDGKYYKANPNNGNITLVNQTTLPLQGNNLRGDMASCVGGKEKDDDDHHHHHGDGDDDDEYGRYVDNDEFAAGGRGLRVGPNPVNVDEMTLFINTEDQSPAEMRIVDANGNTMQMRRLSLARGINQVRVLVRDLRPGIFAVVIVYPSGKTSTVKFIRI